MRVKIALLLVFWLLLGSTGKAVACSLALPTIDTYINASEVIALGTLVDETEDVITLQVDTYLKGSVRAPTLTINNHYFALGPDCSLSLGSGSRWPAGGSVLVFLKQDRYAVGAEWMPAGGLAEAVLIVDGERLRASSDMPTDFGSLAEAKAMIAAVEGPPQPPEANALQQPPQGLSRSELHLKGITSIIVLGVGGLALVAVALWAWRWRLRRVQ